MRRVLALLLVISQALAGPLHAVAAPANSSHRDADSPDCPMSDHAAGDSGPTESCECPGGACCFGRVDRPSAAVFADLQVLVAAPPATETPHATPRFDLRRTPSTIRSRAPPGPRLR